jgi:hypothetical protein
VSNGTRVVVDPSDYVEGLYLVEEKAMPVYTSRYYKYENGKFVEVTETKQTSTYASTRRFFSIKTSKKHYNFEPDIMKNIEEKKWVYAQYQHPGVGGYQHSQWKQGDWRRYYGVDDYSEYYGAGGMGSWEGYGLSPSGYPETPPFTEKNPIDKNLPVPVGKQMPIDAIIHAAQGMRIIDEDDEKDFNICSECIHRDEHLEWFLENAELIDEATDEDIDKLQDNFLSKDDVEEMMMKDQSPAAINDEVVKMLKKHNIKPSIPPKGIPMQPIRAFDKAGKLIPFITKLRGRL